LNSGDEGDQKAMIEILEMRDSEIYDLLRRINYGHLAFARDAQPYVVPIYYAYDDEQIYIYTTAGLKSEVIKSNPKICLQIEEILDDGAWRSAMVTGEAFEIDNPAEREKAVELLRSSNPTLLPALAIKWANDWMRKNVEVVYRIKIITASGRFTSDIRVAAASVKPNFCG